MNRPCPHLDDGPCSICAELARLRAAVGPTPSFDPDPYTPAPSWDPDAFDLEVGRERIASSFRPVRHRGYGGEYTLTAKGWAEVARHYADPPPLAR